MEEQLNKICNSVRYDETNKIDEVWLRKQLCEFGVMCAIDSSFFDAVLTENLKE